MFWVGVMVGGCGDGYGGGGGWGMRWNVVVVVLGGWEVV